MPLTLLTILTLAVPSRNPPDTAYHPYACGPPQDETTTLPPISALTNPTLTSQLITILMLLWCPQDMALSPRSTPCTPNILSTADHPYAQVLDP
ncbi:hypothetical protein O181_122243 [Austropuccinia psidii MF-1]|uniref:Uncharacterized protein n=1 Tax=Austropuccinia psidii MF-1 TaxID=1389203 RepID=A0A9Q3Q209_9BASI|nr:hypothetical protein [Austropuccinia psidii MF-1]